MGDRSAHKSSSGTTYRFSSSEVSDEHEQTHEKGVAWNAISLSILYLALGTAMPIFNKVLFDGQWGLGGYPFPITASMLQVLATALVLVVYGAARHWYGLLEKRRISEEEHGLPLLTAAYEESWVFGPYFLWKCKLLCLPSFFFAAVISLTNLGLFYLDINAHVLLRSTEILWVVVLAWIIQRETPGWSTLSCCLGLIMGVFLISFDFESGIRFEVKALSINLASALASALMVVTMRYSCVRLREWEPTITVFEITCFKMSMATLLMIPASLAVEIGAWEGLGTASTSAKLLVVAGILLTLLYQSAVVGLAAYTLATTVGIISQGKIIPQLVFGALFLDKRFTLTVPHLLGVTLVVVSTLGYSFLRWWPSYLAAKAKERNAVFFRLSAPTSSTSFSSSTTKKTSKGGRRSRSGTYTPASSSSSSCSSSSSSSAKQILTKTGSERSALEKQQKMKTRKKEDEGEGDNDDGSVFWVGTPSTSSTAALSSRASW